MGIPDIKSLARQLGFSDAALSKAYADYSPEQVLKLLQAAEATWAAAYERDQAGSVPDAYISQRAIELTWLALSCMKNWSGQTGE